MLIQRFHYASYLRFWCFDILFQMTKHAIIIVIMQTGKIQVPHFNVPFNSIIADDRIIYGKLDQNSRYEGDCRIYMFTGQIIEGNFVNGATNKAVMYDTSAGFSLGRCNMNGLQNYVQQYNHKGQLIYAGQYKNNKKNGKGCQYLPGDISLKGFWSNDKRNGVFQRFLGGSCLLTQNYVDNKKQETAILKEKNTQIEKKSNYNLSKYKYYHSREQEKQGYEIIKYGYALTKTQLRTLQCSWSMLDTSLVSMWAAHLQRQLLISGMNKKVYIFGTDLMDLYGGNEMKTNNYQAVSHYTRHLVDNFSLFNGFYECIMFPICFRYHFVLAVVRVQRLENNENKFTASYYDSLSFGQASSISTKIQNFLLLELEQKASKEDYYPRRKQEIKNMNLQYSKNPRQKDGVSCGAFVSYFMKYLCQYPQQREIPQVESIYKFRSLMYESLTKDSLLFEIPKNKTKINLQEVESIQPVGESEKIKIVPKKPLKS